MPRILRKKLTFDIGYVTMPARYQPESVRSGRPGRIALFILLSFEHSFRDSHIERASSS
jgi:hypothetical protein